MTRERIEIIKAWINLTRVPKGVWEGFICSWCADQAEVSKQASAGITLIRDYRLPQLLVVLYFFKKEAENRFHSENWRVAEKSQGPSAVMIFRGPTQSILWPELGGYRRRRSIWTRMEICAALTPFELLEQSKTKIPEVWVRLSLTSGALHHQRSKNKTKAKLQPTLPASVFCPRMTLQSFHQFSSCLL